MTVVIDTNVIVTGDRALRELDGFRGLSILPPRRFVDEHLRWQVGEPVPVAGQGLWMQPERILPTYGVYQIGEV